MIFKSPHIKYALSLLFLISGFFYSANAQGGDLRGFVYEKETGEPVIFTNVILEGTTTGAATDINGFFSIANLSAGDYTILVTNIEYDTLREPVTVENNQIKTLKLFLERSDIQLKTVTVAAKIQEKAEEVQISTVSITPQQINKLPSVGGEPDIAQYLQVLPGVIVTGDQGGQLYIRGGAPIHNKVLLDGMTIYNPFHSIGLFSVFETEIIRNVEVITGGFNAEYGNRISAIVDIKTREGNKSRFAGKVSASPFLAKALVEGPLKKFSDNGSSSSFLVTAKHSYLDKTSATLYPYVNQDENGDSQGIPYTFTDIYGKLSLNGGNGSKFSLFGFGFKDSVNFSQDNSFKWNSMGLGTNFVVVPGQSNILIDGVISYSNYNVVLREKDEKPRDSFVGGFNVGMNFTYFITDGDIQYGFEINGFQTDFNFFNSLGIKIEQRQFTTEMGAFFKLRKVINKKLVVEPGMRIQYYSSLNNFSAEPRLGLKYNVAERFRLKFAGGIYSQNLISTKSDRDVVNLFTGFLSGPEEQIATVDDEPAKNKLQKSIHAVFGIEIDPTDNLELNIEPYYKRFSQLININRDKIFPQDPDFTTETGDAYGIDFLAKYEYKRWYAWVSYSLGWVTRFDGNQKYNPHYDRRHNVNLVLSFIAGETRTWEFGARWNLGSGFPFTQTQGFYESIDFLDGVSTDYTGSNGDLGIIYAEELNGGRLPYYHRLDLSVKKKITFGEHNVLDLSVSVTNIYDRENIFYFDRIRYERVNQLPILPSLSVSFSF